MTPPLIMLVDDEVPFVETMTKRLAKRDLNVIAAFSLNSHGYNSR